MKKVSLNVCVMLIDPSLNKLVFYSTKCGGVRVHFKLKINLKKMNRESVNVGRKKILLWLLYLFLFCIIIMLNKAAIEFGC